MLSETQRQLFSKSVNFNFSSLLDDTVEWIGKNTNPEDVFSVEKLEEKYSPNDKVKALEEMNRLAVQVLSLHKNAIDNLMLFLEHPEVAKQYQGSSFYDLLIKNTKEFLKLPLPNMEHK